MQENSEFKLTRKRDILPPVGRTVSEMVSSPLRGDDGRNEEYSNPNLSRFAESSAGRFTESGVGMNNNVNPRFVDTGNRFGDNGPSRFAETGMSKFGETALSRFTDKIPQSALTPLSALSSQPQDLMSKADAKAEIHFIGQILGGTDFNCTDGLFCEMLLSFGDNWKMLSPPKTYQTQVCYNNHEEMFIWAHPLDLFFSAGDLYGWPKVVFRVWRLDASNKMDTFSYGVTHLPRTAGHHRIECETWTPVGTWKSGALGFFTGTNPRLQSLDVMSDFLEKREFLSTSSSGKVIIELDVLMKNFNLFGISGQNTNEVSRL